MSKPELPRLAAGALTFPMPFYHTAFLLAGKRCKGLVRRCGDRLALVAAELMEFFSALALKEAWRCD